MSRGGVRALAAVLCFVLLSACETLKDKMAALGSGSPAETNVAGAEVEATGSIPETIGSIPETGENSAAAGRLSVDQSYLTGQPLGADPFDDVELGKRHFREQNFGLAEKHFRRAIEKSPGSADRNLEAWLGLAAAYDRLRRFELADRAYANAIKIAGPNAAILNNQGYSYMLRGDYRTARVKLAAARAQDPENPYVRNNIELLERSVRGR